MHKYYTPPKIYQTREELDKLLEEDRGSDLDDKEIPEPLTLEEFAAAISVNPVTNEAEDGFHAGSNHIGFLLGDIGRGKSVFATKLFSILREDMLDQLNTTTEESSWLVVPVYIDIGDIYVDASDGEIKNIGDEIFQILLEAISKSITRGSSIERKCNFQGFSSNGISFESDLSELIAYLITRSVRIVLILDNLDQYHFQYKKYAFIQEYADLQDKSVKSNIGGLVERIEKRLEKPGLCVLFVCRKYVYDHLRLVQDNLWPWIDSSTVYQLDNVPTTEIVESRRLLYVEAETGVRGRYGTPQEALGAFRRMMEVVNAERTDTTPVFHMLKRISHHGHRGLVEFLSELKIHDDKGDVFRRIFDEQQVLLLILYINKQKMRFSQDNEHFPNIFLCDLSVKPDDSYPAAVEAHKHTYWLKYFILKYVATKEEATVAEVVDLFTSCGYQETLVRVVLGSLTTSNFYCLQVDVSSGTSIGQKRLRATDRGAALVGKEFDSSSKTNAVEFCFSFVYLQLMVEDYLMAFPKSVLDAIKPDGDYGYIYLRDNSYGLQASKVVRNRSKASIWFLKILIASLNAELEMMSDIKEAQEIVNLVPDLELVEESLFQEIGRVGKAIGRSEAREIFSDLKHEKQAFSQDVSLLEDFFRDFYGTGILVSG